MNKLFTKIAALALGAAMVVGVGVSVGSTKITQTNAGDGDTHKFEDVAFSKLLNNNATINSVTIAQQSYVVKKITTNVRYNKTAGGVTISPVIGTTPLDSQTFNKSATEDLVWDVDPAVKGAITFNFTNNCGSGNGKGTFYFNSVTLTEGADSSKIATTTSITVPGGKTTLDYSVSPADSVQLTAAVSYSGGSVPGSSVTWASSNPSVATVTNGLVTAAGKGTTTITASYAGDTTYGSSMDQVAINVIDPNEALFNFADLATQYSWVNGTAYTPVVVNDVSLSTASGGNNAKYYSSDSTWRMYSGGTLSITAPSGKYITGVSSNPAHSFSIAGDAQSATASFSSNVSFKEITVSLTSTKPSVLYTVSYNANLVGYTGSVPPSTTQASEGAAVEIAAALSSDGYTFDGWNTASDGTGTDVTPGATDYVPTSNVTLFGQWTAVPSGDLSLTFDVSSNPGGWPTDNQSTLTDYTYTLNDATYTFSLKNVKCNSGYLMCTSVAVLGLPAISGYKLTKVVANNSSGCSTSTSVGISSSSSEATYITGGAAQTWSTTGSAYTYTLSNTEEDTQYFMYVTNKNAQILSLTLSYEEDETPGTKVQLAAEGFSMDVGQTDVAPVVTNADTHEVITGCHFESSDETVVSIVSEKVHAVANGTATITVTHDPDTVNQITYKSATFTVNVTQVETIQSIVTQCAAITSAAGVIDGTHTIQGTVTGLYGNHFMIQQGDYAMYIYTGGSGGTDYGVALNDVVRVTGTFGKYSKWIETRSITSVSKVEGATPETISPYHATNPADLTDVYQNRLVTFTGLTWVSGTYTAGTSASITFKDANENTIYLRTDSAVDDAIETQIATKIKAISDDEGKTLVVDLVGVHYTIFYSGGTTQQQFKVTNADKISYHTKTATDEEIVDEFVEERLKWSTYDPDHREGVDGDNLCLGPDGYYLNAKNALTTQLTERQQNLFKHTGEFATQEDKYAAPRARYEAWALAYGDTTPYAITVGSGRIVLDPLGLVDHNPTAIIIISAIGVSALGGFFFLRKRKEI